MPPVTSLVAFGALSAVLVPIPGPSVMFVVSRAVSLGRRAALLTVVGNAVGLYLQVLLVAAGLGVVVEKSAVVFTSVKLVGAGYLVWLGVQAIAHRKELAQVLDAAGTVRRRRSLVQDGIVVGVTNPKTVLFFTAILPQFVEAGGAPAASQMAVLGLVFVVIALVLDSAWGLVAGTARTWFLGSPQRLEKIGGAGGLVMVGLGLSLAFSTRQN
ncbi:MAG: LysE family translocator [Acidimicrobiia bacterium]|nr:LysE family translocator [Actinomycetota bacterium]MBL6925979.1 LysE family translocator [Acidimicrobiia bacterium]